MQTPTAHGGLPSQFDDQTTIQDDPAPDLDFLRRMFREACESTVEQRLHAAEDRDYFDGPGQLDRATRAKLRARNTPETYYTKISAAVGKVLGLFDANESAPEALARNQDGEAAADVVTQVLRYQADKTRFQVTLAAIQRNYLVEGIGAAKVEVDHKNNCDVQHIPYEHFYYDPRSMKPDFSDATYLIHAYWVDLSKVKRQWPAASGMVSCFGFQGEGPEDQPACARYWVDPDRQRVMIVDCFYEDEDTGGWKRAIYCHSTLLEHGDSGYLNDEGEHICPIVAVAYHVMREGEKIGMVRNLVPQQRTINGLQAAMHRLAISNRVKMVPNGNGNAADRDLARREAQRTDGALPEGWDLLGANQVLVNLAQEVAILKQEIEDSVPGNAQLAQAGANTSGRARQMLQQSGMADLAMAMRQIEDFEERCYRQMWFCARQFMTERDEMMVTDNAGVRQALVINDPITEQQMRPVLVPQADPSTGQPIQHPVTGQALMRPAIHPMTGQVLHAPVHVQTGTENHLAEMDMQITLKVVPLADTLRGEAKQQLMEWSAKSGISPLNPAFRLLIEISDIPDKAEILRIYQDCVAQDQQMQAPAQAQQQQAAEQQQQVTATAVEAKAAKDQAAAQRDQTLAIKHQVDTQSAQLDNAWKEALLRSGHNPNDSGF